MRNGFYSADDAFRLLVLDLSANTLYVKHIVSGSLPPALFSYNELFVYILIVNE